VTPRTFPARADSIREVRRHVQAELAGVDDEVVHAVVLMVSELATNSVRHAATDFSIEVTRTADVVRVAVADEHPDEPVLQTPADDDPSGRGLRIVAELADRWGTEAGSPGKQVWFEVRIGGGGRRDDLRARREDRSDGPRSVPRRGAAGRRRPGGGPQARAA
jgi:anti-sigma regulatory factor (Ser/Thr protein kinase)